jgi:two-component system sensor histidine kinase KdpD
VGKTYAMLQEAQRRKVAGTDVVVGLVETHGRAKTTEQIGDLEVIAPRQIPYKGVTLQEMDTAAVIARHPRIALVDELAHTNAPGSKHDKRYEDVKELLDAGIDVVSTLNIQHIESLHDIVEEVTGISVRERIPDHVLDEAEQIELIDMAPEALRRRMVHGNVYPQAQATRALENFFTVGNLTALRDLALRATAREVEQKLSEFMREDQATDTAVGAGNKVMVAIDHRPSGMALVRRGRRIATALKGELVVVHVDPSAGRRQPQSVEEERQLRSTLLLAGELGATVVRLRAKVSEELMGYARNNHVATLIIGHPTHGRWEELFHGSVTNDILLNMRGLDVIVAPDSPVSRHEEDPP